METKSTALNKEEVDCNRDIINYAILNKMLVSDWLEDQSC